MLSSYKYKLVPPPPLPSTSMISINTNRDELKDHRANIPQLYTLAPILVRSDLMMLP